MTSMRVETAGHLFKVYQGRRLLSAGAVSEEGIRYFHLDPDLGAVGEAMVERAVQNEIRGGKLSPVTA